MASARTVLAIFFLVAATAAAGPTNKEWKEGQAKKAAGAAAVGAKDAKMAAVNKVISMLTDLQAQVLAEGEAEAATYNKFACFCKTTQNDKTDAIKTGTDEKGSLSADIVKLSKERDGLDTKIAGLQKDIKAAEDKMAAATRKSDKSLATYTTNEADMKAAISALNDAIKVLKSSKSPSLVQLQSIGNTIKQAALMADALGLGGEQADKVALFLQQTSEDVPVEMEDYKFHSGDIISTLEKLLGDFRSEKSGVDADEVKRVQNHNMLIQDQNDLVKAKTLEMNQSKKARDGKIEDIGTASQELSTTSADLLDNQQYLDELNTMCSNKAKTWDQRSRVRANELTAITQATGIIKSTVVEKTQSATLRLASTGQTIHFADAVASSDSAMESIEAEAEAVDGADSFLQKKSVRAHPKGTEDAARQMIISLFKGKGAELHSAVLTSLATRMAGDPLAKVKKLIQELIERLLTESANEANQKGWCDKAMADATQKRQYAADEIEDLNAKMAKQEALSAKLKEELATLADETKQLNDKVKEAEKSRKEEKTENSNTVTEAKAGLDAVNMAIDILDKFYKSNDENKVDLSLAQGPADDAPDAGFGNGEAYQGAGAESGGIIGMMEVIQSDFQRTISETKKSEKEAEDDHLEFMTESGKSLAEKKMATTEKTRLKGSTDDNFDDTEDSMTSQSKLLVTSIKELIELKATCIDTGMSYADRVAMREQEIASLKKAMCILGAYAEFGPDGLADAC